MIQDKSIEILITELKSDATKSGYNINSDEELVYDLAGGLLVNRERYGYQFCPCKLSEGSVEKDMDLICPCDYRDMDLDEYGTCYCGLYVSAKVLQSKSQVKPIPDRRKKSKDNKVIKISGLKSSYPIWRCKVCGYLCARNTPPEKCPICKTQRERFEEFN
ncbi:ferredoxin:glutaredoxin reductase [Alkalibaculum sp. M08DMB]|uniref:ferredoxin:thioredoxin reductase n=1 Tax=Alkalibaculum sporogenes TaxID=2655001 RepID=A0A6A7KBE2_9FIRM|nr:ferredoxin:glutaredoxin reductase [Alkalibaculum sporogenes]